MTSARPDAADRAALGAWYTPETLVEMLIERTFTSSWARQRRPGTPLRVLDPACGDGRFLISARRAAHRLGVDVEVVGIDVHPAAIATAQSHLGAETRLICADALEVHLEGTFDLILGNPPFVSPLSAATPRRSSWRTELNGAYANLASAFLWRALEWCDPDQGRIAMILPQSILAARDASDLRSRVDARCRRLWSWWSPDRHFDAQVHVCALGLERVGMQAGSEHPTTSGIWAPIAAAALGVPELPRLRTLGTLGDRVQLNANFRDEYYGLVGAVVEDQDHVAGPPLVTSGLIDPGICHWGERPVRFAKHRYLAPRVVISRLDDQMRSWAHRKLVPKVLIASQTRIIEAVADPHGRWLPGVPVTSAVPMAGLPVSEVAAVLTGPVASASLWWSMAGSGLSTEAIRVGPTSLATVPWPAGSLEHATAALDRHDLDGCAAAVTAAYGLDPETPRIAALLTWWRDRVPPGTSART